MKKCFLSKSLASLATGIALAAPVFSQAQTVPVIPTGFSFSGTVNQVWGNSSIPVETFVTGDFSFNPADFSLYSGNGSTTLGSVYYDPYGSLSYTADGITTTTQGVLATVAYESLDLNDNLVCSFSFTSGTGNANGVVVSDPLGTIQNSSIASLWAIADDGLFASIPSDSDFQAGFTTSSLDGVMGPISSFSATFLPPHAPTPAISLSPPNLVLTWPTNATSYALQQTSSLLGGWSAVTNAVAVTNGLNCVTVSSTNISAFFRLAGTNY